MVLFISGAYRLTESVQYIWYRVIQPYTRRKVADINAHPWKMATMLVRLPVPSTQQIIRRDAFWPCGNSYIATARRLQSQVVECSLTLFPIALSTIRDTVAAYSRLNISMRVPNCYGLAWLVTMAWKEIAHRASISTSTHD